MLSDKLEANLGYVYENAIAQMLASKGYKLFYYTMKSETSNHLYEVDFLISEGDKISPIEVKSCNYRQHKSLEVFCEKFSRRVKNYIENWRRSRDFLSVRRTFDGLQTFAVL